MEVYNSLLIILASITLVSGLFMSNEIVINSSHRVKKVNLQRIFTCLLMTILIVVSGARESSVGIDTRNYVYRYAKLGQANWENLFNLSSAYSFEYGFSVFCKLLYSLSDDYKFFLAITSLWTGILFYIAIKKNSKFPVLSVLIYYCWGFWGASMNVIREMMIIPLLYVALEKARNKEPVKFFAIVVVSSLIHTAAILFIPIYFFVNIKINKKTLLIAIISTIIMGISGPILLGNLLRWTSFGWYFETAKNTSGWNTLFLMIIILLISYVFQKQLLEIDEKANVWTLFIMIAMISTSIALSVGIFERVTKLFITSILFLFPDYIVLAKRHKAGCVALIVLVALLAYYFLRIIMISSISSSRIIPYITWAQ